MTTYQQLTVERANHVAVVTLNRPECLNALSGQLMRELVRLAGELHDDEETRAVIFTGAGEHFSAGADLKDPERAERGGDSQLMRWRYLQNGPRMIRAIAEMSQITIAAIRGVALGGAACIATACDFRVGADDCRVGYPEINLAMNLSWGALPLAVHLVGPARAKRLVILGRHEDAETLCEWGFLDEVTSVDELMPRAHELAAEVAAKPPLAAQMIKRSINAIVSALDRSIMHADTDQFMLATQMDDHGEAITAFFQKREGRFKGR